MNKQSKSGITLIALIITIIVMLILVGVTVTVAINGGLFKSAKEGAEGTTMARVKEQMMGDITTKIAEKLGDNITESELETIAQKYGTIIEKDGIKYLKLTDGGYEVPLSEIWQVETVVTLASLYCDEEGCTNAEHLHKGDYVEYRPKTEQTTYAPDKGEGIGKYTGYTGGTAEQSIPQFETVLKNTCEVLYSNTELGATARSITMDDIDTYLGGSKYKKEEFGGGISKSGGYGYQNVSAIISKFKYDKEANTLTKEDCTIPAKDLTNDVYHYYATTGLIGTKNREILFGKEYEKTYYNWVASRAVYVDSGDAYWCGSGARYAYVATDYDFSYSNGREDKDSLCLRPIVSLPSSVTIEQVSKKDGEVTETWNDPLNEY